MGDAELVERLAAFPTLADVPREELEWLVAHGTLDHREEGEIMIHSDKLVDSLWIVLSGRITVVVDRGAGPKRVMDWIPGDVTGMLPYSRMKHPPGHNFAPEAADSLRVRVEHFPEMIRTCPKFTALCVHEMLDRARNFNTSDLHDEKMMSLGRLSAGLAHELNNPASATVRGAKLLLESLDDADRAALELGAAGVAGEDLLRLEQLRTRCVAKPADSVLSPIEQADREDELASWLEAHDLDPAHAHALSETAVTIGALDELAGSTSPETLGPALRWIASGCATHALATDIEHAATRIYELVGAIKRFTHMDSLSGPDFVEVEAGLRDTLRVLASKAKSKGASVTLEIEPDLPTVHANGGELNQIWLNLIDNALDAVSDEGHVEITARSELDRVVVRVVDDGPGIPEDLLTKIFDPFFTTKPPGEGTGLGLDIARRLVRRYRGDMTVDSRPGRTEFCVSLEAEREGVAPKE